MSKARDLSNLLNSSGKIESAKLSTGAVVATGNITAYGTV